MRRLLVIILVLLIPMQSSLAAVVSVGGMSNFGCDQAMAVIAPGHAHDAAGMTHSMAGYFAGGAHGGVHVHSCPHLGGFALASVPATLPEGAGASQIASIGHASFKSVVLDVPSPPPMTGA